MSYSWSDYCADEREQFEKMKKLLKEGHLSYEDRKAVKGLRDWHFQNCMENVRRPGVLRCVKSYVFGHRERPSPKEIQQEYSERREFFERRAAKREKIYYKIVFAFALLAALFVIFKLR